MIRRIVVLALASISIWTAAAGVASAQEIQRGKLKKLDVEKRSIVVTIDGKDQTFKLSDDTQVLGATGKDLAERLQGFKEGANISVRAGDGGTLTGLRLDDAPVGGNAPGAADGNRPQRVKVKKVDAERRTITLTVDGKDIELTANDRTQFRGTSGKALAEQLAEFKPDAEVMFLARKQDGKDVLVGLAMGGGGGGAPRREGSGQRVSPDTSSFKPITELGKAEYRGFTGGLYPNGENARPAAHEAAGLKLARQVQPLNAAGKPDPQGRIVLLSIGMSNTSQSSQGFQQALADESGKNPRFLFVNGAQGGMTAAAIQNPDDGGRGSQYWGTVDQRLQQAGVTRDQVQIAWIKQADAGPSQGFPRYAQTLQAELTRIVQVLTDRFPNCKLAYLSSRTYGGYATTSLNPEPYAYESAFSVKWLIEEQLKGNAALNFNSAKGDVKSPWLSWGPYLWANGTTKRVADGFMWEETDVPGDGTHQSASGQRKVGRLLFDFFKSDTTTRDWFLRK
jgi:Cu/Ag efflux protein CusF